MKFFFWIAVLVVALVLALFAVSNRAPATFEFWPLPGAVELPLYLAVLVALLTGFVGGAAAAWLVGQPRRRAARRCRRRLAVLERELAATQAQLPGAMAPGPST